MILEVPFSEKDAAKSLGAKWNQKIKKWYVPRGVDEEGFNHWVPTEGSLTVMPPLFILKSWETCWSCGESADVFCLASAGVIDDDDEEKEELNMFIQYLDLTYIPDYLDTIFKTKIPRYFMDYTKMSNSHYYVNHCHCNAKLGDFYLHHEPEGAFHPICDEHAQEIIMYNLGFYGSVKIDASYEVGDSNFIPRNAKREDLKF